MGFSVVTDTYPETRALSAVVVELAAIEVGPTFTHPCDVGSPVCLYILFFVICKIRMVTKVVKFPTEGNFKTGQMNRFYIMKIDVMSKVNMLKRKLLRIFCSFSNFLVI